VLDILYFNTLDSTQTYIINEVKNNNIKIPSLIYTHNQTNGIGSRNNTWKGIKGNLFFSFVIKEDMLSSDLPISSISIYFGYIIKDILHKLHSKVHLKWPNDLYINQNKIGGIITNKKQDLIFIGVGINLIENDKNIHFLDISLNIDDFFNKLIHKITHSILWSEIFKLYKVEFYSNDFNHTTNINKKSTSLKDAILNNDGSITINNKKVYSLR
jgi:BirA family biotin operon repressor/biotin-[acetyl-CoA-carboxylase] ligase